MYFISNSMPKSASTLLCELMKKAVGDIYGGNGQEALENATARGEVEGGGSFVKTLSDRETTNRLHEISMENGPFVVKVHSALDKPIRAVIESGQAKVSFIYRDPRNALLSAMDNYIQSRQKNKPEFVDCHSFESALNQFTWLSDQAVLWKQSGLASILKYEDFVQNIPGELYKLLVSLNLELSDEKLQRIVSSALEKQKSAGWNLRFNKGIIDRYKQEMTAEQIGTCERTLGTQLADLGYALS